MSEYQATLNTSNALNIGKQFPTLLTVELGTFKTIDQLKEALKESGHYISSDAYNMIDNPAFSLSRERCKLDLVKVSISDLGFDYGAITRDIYSRAIELGLELCPSEVGPQLRLQYTNQPENEVLSIAMEAIMQRQGWTEVFLVNHECDRSEVDGNYVDCRIALYTFWSDQNNFRNWHAGDLIFVKPQQA